MYKHRRLSGCLAQNQSWFWAKHVLVSCESEETSLQNKYSFFVSTPAISLHSTYQNIFSRGQQLKYDTQRGEPFVTPPNEYECFHVLLWYCGVVWISQIRDNSPPPASVCQFNFLLHGRDVISPIKYISQWHSADINIKRGTITAFHLLLGFSWCLHALIRISRHSRCQTVYSLYSRNCCSLFRWSADSCTALRIK